MKQGPNDPNLSETSEVSWDRIVGDLEEILKPRPVKGPIQNRGEAETGQDLWDLSLQQELAHDGSESDKARGRKYIKSVAEKAKEQDRLARCKSWQWLCKRRARAETVQP